MSINENTTTSAPRGGSAVVCSQSGFSLIEIMISLVLLTIGLLALAGLQTRGLRGGNSSYQRSQATILTYDIIDRMRANRVAIYSAACVNLSGYDVNLGAGVPPFSANVIANADLTQWKASLGGLPLGDGQVRVTVTAPVPCEINKVTATAEVIVQWDDDRNGAVAVPGEQVRTTSRL